MSVSGARLAPVACTHVHRQAACRYACCLAAQRAQRRSGLGTPPLRHARRVNAGCAMQLDVQCDEGRAETRVGARTGAHAPARRDRARGGVGQAPALQGSRARASAGHVQPVLGSPAPTARHPASRQPSPAHMMLSSAAASVWPRASMRYAATSVTLRDRPSWQCTSTRPPDDSALSMKSRA